VSLHLPSLEDSSLVSEGTRAKASSVIALAPSVEVSLALTCGVIASDRFALDDAQLLRMWIAWLVVDIVIGLVFAQWRVLKGADLSQVVKGAEGETRVLFPYAVSGSPGARLSRSINGFVSQWEETVWPLAGKAGLTAILGAALALAMATFLGRTILAIVALGLVFGVGLVVACGEREVLSRWLRFLHVSLAWLVGGRLLGPLRMPVVGFALLMGLAAYVREGLGAGGSAGFVWFLRITNWSLVLMLLFTQQPALAFVIAIGFLAEAMSRGERGLKANGYTLYKIPWLVSMLTVALAVTRW
jgi:hypothetical protein